MPFVSEVYHTAGRQQTGGFGYPDFDDAFAHGLDNDAITQAMEENRINLNTELPAYSQIDPCKNLSGRIRENS